MNVDLEASPDLINSDPYGKGWLVVLKGADPSHFDSLMTAEQYASFIGEFADVVITEALPNSLRGRLALPKARASG